MSRVIDACPHKNLPHYCRGRCKSCYYKWLRRNDSSPFRRNRIVSQRIYSLKHDFGLTTAEYAQLLDKQNGLCFICQCPSNRNLAVDHDHTTSKVRGLLCVSCNTKLGWFEKYREIIVEYLEGRH